LGIRRERFDELEEAWVVANGCEIFNTYWTRCQGGATILSDLRRSTPGISTGLEKTLDGSLADRGTPGFAELDNAAIRRAARLLAGKKLAAQK
jgi:hypothetical protein